MTSLRFYGNFLVTLMCVITMTQITYNTPSRAVSDLQSPPPRALRALGIGDCKSDTALLGCYNYYLYYCAVLNMYIIMTNLFMCSYNQTSFIKQCFLIIMFLSISQISSFLGQCVPYVLIALL